MYLLVKRTGHIQEVNHRESLTDHIHLLRVKHTQDEVPQKQVELQKVEEDKF